MRRRASGGGGGEAEGGRGCSGEVTYVQAAAELPLAAHLDVDALVQGEADEVNGVQRLRHGAGGRAGGTHARNRELRNRGDGGGERPGGGGGRSEVEEGG